MNSYNSPSIAVVDLSPFLERSKSDKHFKLLENSSNNAKLIFLMLKEGLHLSYIKHLRIQVSRLLLIMESKKQLLII